VNELEILQADVVVLLLHALAEAEQVVVHRERLAVAPLEVWPKLEGERLAIRGDVPLGGSVRPVLQ
jgi:hypothetical protein